MYKYLLYFILFTFLICCKGTQQSSIKRIEDSSSSTFIGMTNNVYLFKKEQVTGDPFTNNFISFSNIKAYALDKKKELLLFDTTVFSSNQYSDIRFLKMNLDSFSDLINLVFQQCPDGDDPCVYTEYALKL